MIKIIFLLTLLFISAPFVIAQSVTITPKKTVYKRPKPIADYKKNFTITRPIVKAQNAALSKKIEKAISFETVQNLNLKEEFGEFQGLDDASYVVDYNKKGILVVTLSMEVSGAYPSTVNEKVVINTKTGTRITPQTVFTNLSELAAKCKTMQRAEIKKAAADYKKDAESKDFDGKEYFDNANFTAKNLDKFDISDKGVTFNYDYEFPHVVQALQPDGAYFFTWAQMKPYIKKDGAFAQFVK